MTKGLDTLHSIEAMADRATVQELRRMIRHVEEFRLALAAAVQRGMCNRRSLSKPT
jgi:hypothetical protein